jgi:4-amino-4-deoxy-L-arabinose transferase-like glycosyltransferase
MIKHISANLTKFETRSGYQYLLLAAITLLATGLRFYKLGEWSFWIDEIATIRRAQAHVNLETIINEWWRPPLSLILIDSALDILGVSEWSARLVPTVIGIISIPVLYFPIKKLFGPAVALVALFLLAISPWHLYWSQNARFYTSLMLLYSLASFAFFLGIEQDRPWYIFGFFLLLFLAVGERIIALFLPPVVICYLLLLKIMPFEKPPGLRTRNLLFLLLPGIAFVIHEVYAFATNGNAFLAHTIDTFVGQSNHGPLRLLFAIIFRISLPLVCLGFFGGLYLLNERKRAGLFIFLAAVAPPLLLLLVAPFTFTVDRYVFETLPFWAILSAVTIKEIFVRTEQYGKLIPLGVFSLVLATALSQNMLYYEFQNGDRPDWKGAFAIIQQRKADTDLVVATRPELGYYYLNDKVRSINSLDPIAIELNGNKIWFIIDEATGGVEPILEQWIRENSDLVDIRDVYQPGKSLSIRIYLYDPVEMRSRVFHAIQDASLP